MAGSRGAPGVVAACAPAGHNGPDKLGMELWTTFRPSAVHKPQGCSFRPVHKRSTGSKPTWLGIMRIIHRIHSPYEYYVNNKNPKLFKVRGVDRSPLRCTTGAQNEEQSHDDHHGGSASPRPPAMMQATSL